MTDTHTEAAVLKPPHTLFRSGADVIPVRTIDSQLHVLLATMGQGPHRGRRGTIGGHMANRETWAETGARELFEQARLTADPRDLVPLVVLGTLNRDLRDGVRGIGRVFLLDADRIGGAPKAGDDVARIEWIAVTDLIDLIAKGEETFAYDHAESLAAACLHVTTPGLWPPATPTLALSLVGQLASREW